jgi:hypothetical protein
MDRRAYNNNHEPNKVKEAVKSEREQELEYRQVELAKVFALEKGRRGRPSKLNEELIQVHPTKAYFVS